MGRIYGALRRLVCDERNSSAGDPCIGIDQFRQRGQLMRGAPDHIQAVDPHFRDDGLNMVWSAPHQLPTLAELVDPDAWITRTAVPFVTK